MRQLVRLDIVGAAEGMNVAGWNFHYLTGDLAGHYAVSVSGNWRLTISFEGRDAVLVD